MHFVLQDIEAMVHLGITPAEQDERQALRFVIEFDFDTSTAAQTDDIADTADYQMLYDTVKTITQSGRWNLLESLHAEIFLALKEACPEILNLTLRITKKPWTDGRVVVSN